MEMETAVWSMLLAVALLSTPQATVDGFDVCREFGSVPPSTTADLCSTLERPTVDLIFILDVSRSVGQEGFTDIIDFLRDFLLFASVSCDLHIRPDTTRVDLLTFENDARSHLEHLNSVTGCDVLHKISNIQYRENTGRTYVHNATDTAVGLLQTWARERYVDSQVVVVLTDGEFNDDAKDLALAIERLRRHEVKIYTVGVGQYLNSRDKIQALKTLALTDFHAACLQDWREALIPSRETFRPERPVWVTSSLDSADKCRTPCPRYAICACDVTWPKYGCTCLGGFTLEDDNGQCEACPDGTHKDGLGNDDDLCEDDDDDDGLPIWAIVVAVLSGVVVIVVITLVVAYLVQRW